MRKVLWVAFAALVSAGLVFGAYTLNTNDAREVNSAPITKAPQVQKQVAPKAPANPSGISNENLKNLKLKKKEN